MYKQNMVYFEENISHEKQLFSILAYENLAKFVEIDCAGYHGNGTCKQSFSNIYVLFGWSKSLCKTYITCNFPGGPDPMPPPLLDPRMKYIKYSSIQFVFA